MSKTSTNITTLIFDLGGVLIDWNPRHLYQKLFKEPQEMNFFLNHICNQEWNFQQDAGRPFSDAVKELTQLHPQYQEQIEAYDKRWEEMLGDADFNTVRILEDYKNSRLKLYALTNWSHEKFPIALQRYPFLSWFEGIVVSGEEKMKKPDIAIYKTLIDRYAIEPSQSIYIDDSLENVLAAETIGMSGIHFRSAEQLKEDLSQQMQP